MRKFSYVRTLNNPPKLQIKEGAKEVIFTTVSCMCDNIKYIRFKKNKEGDFKMNGKGFALSNWQMKHPTHDVEWVADEGNWTQVIEMLNTGTSKVCDVKSR